MSDIFNVADTRVSDSTETKVSWARGTEGQDKVLQQMLT